MPAAGMGEWMGKPESERKEAEDKMRADWNTWMAAHPGVTDTAGTGKNTRVTAAGAAPQANDVMLSSYTEAESPEAAAAIFVGHPHLAIPGSWIDVMPVNQIR